MKNNKILPPPPSPRKYNSHGVPWKMLLSKEKYEKRFGKNE